MDEHKLLHDIERLLKKQIDTLIHPGYEPDPKIRAEPILLRSAGTRGGQRPQGARSGSGSVRGGAPKPSSGSRGSSPKPSNGSHRSGTRHH